MGMKVSKCATISWTTITIISSKMMKQPSAQWTTVNRRALVSILLVETNGRYSNLANDYSGWNRVVASLVSKTGFNYTHAMVKIQCGTMKKHFREFEKYANQSGFGMDGFEA